MCGIDNKGLGVWKGLIEGFVWGKGLATDFDPLGSPVYFEQLKSNDLRIYNAQIFVSLKMWQYPGGNT